MVFIIPHNWILLESVESSLRYRSLHLHTLSHLLVCDVASYSTSTFDLRNYI